MQILTYDTPQSAAAAAAMAFADEIIKKPRAALGLATGSTPIPLYREFIRLNRAGMIDFSRVTTWNLDEYVGLAPDHPAGYRYFMNEQLFRHVNIDIKNTHVPSGTADDLAREAAAYDAAIAASGGIDIQLLGIGHNGHIGFNEPGDVFTYETHVMELTQSTIDANARNFDAPGDVPQRAISMGVGAIMAARRIVLIATGAGKARAIAGMVNGPIDPGLPASILRCHVNVQVFLDKAAAGSL
jgi:glucosamine-6-phosphate deaminase